MQQCIIDMAKLIALLIINKYSNLSQFLEANIQPLSSSAFYSIAYTCDIL